MVTRKNDSNGSHWSKSTTAIAAYVVAISTGINQGVNQFTDMRHDPYTGKMHEDYAKHIEQEHNLMRTRMQQDRETFRDLVNAMSEEMRKYSDKNAEDTRLKLLLHLAENYLDKNEIPPDRVTEGLARANAFQRTMLDRMQNQDERMQQLSDRMTRCCYSFENSSLKWKTDKLVEQPNGMQ